MNLYTRGGMIGGGCKCGAKNCDHNFSMRGDARKHAKPETEKKPSRGGPRTPRVHEKSAETNIMGKQTTR